MGATSGVDSDSVLDLLLLFKGSGEGASYSASSVGGRVGEAADLGEAGLFEEETAFFLFNGPEEVAFFRGTAALSFASAVGSPEVGLDFFWAGLNGRSWFGSNFMRVDIDP